MQRDAARGLALPLTSHTMTDALPAILILGSVIAGFAWGRISSRLPIPEMLRLLTTPVWTGTLMVIAGWFFSVTRLDWNAARVVDAATLGPASIVRMTLSYGMMCFLIGAVFGLPATLGWVLGYRPPAKNQSALTGLSRLPVGGRRSARRCN